MRSVAAPLALLALLALAAGCGGDEDGSAGPASFEGVPWVLASGLDVAGFESAAPSATFEDGTVGGSTGCNRYTAPYTVDGDELEIGQVAATLMACPPPADAVERAYVAALESVAAWRTEDDALVLEDADGTERLRYTTPSLVGEWTATSILTPTALTSPLPGTEITASFSVDGRLSGSSGCNTYTATYSADRGELEIGQPAGTRKACAEPEGVMAQEAAYLAALPSAARYRIDGGLLELLAADGTFVATYVRAT
jgi:heat shock protein HslJ